jgi:hypothetical protein
MNSMQSFYVILDNVILRDPTHAGYTRLEASSGPELLERVKERYELNHPACIIELWSHEPGHLNRQIRIDILTVIPEEHQFIWIKAKSKRA